MNPIDSGNLRNELIGDFTMILMELFKGQDNIAAILPPPLFWSIIRAGNPKTILF